MFEICSFCLEFRIDLENELRLQTLVGRVLLDPEDEQVRKLVHDAENDLERKLKIISVLTNLKRYYIYLIDLANIE